VEAARILLEREGPIVTLTLNRPDKLNAIDGAMLDALEAALSELEADAHSRVVIVTGAGRAFSAGADIKEWTALTPGEFGPRWGMRGHRLFDRLAGLRPPVIAALNGIAFGGGLELALCADLRIAAAEARLGLPEVTIGAIPGWGGTQRLPRLIGPGRAKHMILTGQPLEAARAEAWGLVSEVVEAARLMARAREVAQQIAANAPLSVQAAKRLVDAALAGSPAATLEVPASMACGASEDAREGRQAFLERRPPRYLGR